MTAFSQPAHMYGSRQWTKGAIRINSFSTYFSVHKGKKSMDIISAKTLPTNQTSFAKSLPPTSRHRVAIHHQQTNGFSCAMQNTPDKQSHCIFLKKWCFRDKWPSTLHASAKWINPTSPEQLLCIQRNMYLTCTKLYLLWAQTNVLP